MEKLVNLTPHVINVVDSDGCAVLDIPASGVVARCSQQETVIGTFAGVTITTQAYGDIVDLPKPVEGVRYIVSRLVAEASKGSRADLLVPGPLVRNADGQPCGCKGLSVI